MRRRSGCRKRCRLEETRFAHTMDVGLKKLEALLKSSPEKLAGEDAFKLYDTFGMPLDFMQDAARDQGIEFDQAGFDRAMEEQKTRARASWKGRGQADGESGLPAACRNRSLKGIGRLGRMGARCWRSCTTGQGVQELKAGEEGEVILDHTPFYAESGGQVGDRGWLYSDDHNTVVAEVKGCYYPIQGVRAHQVVVKIPPYENRVGRGTLKVGEASMPS